MLESFGVESTLKCVSWRKMMSALQLHLERCSWERFSGMLRLCAFREVILVVDLACLVDKRVIVGVKVVFTS